MTGVRYRKVANAELRRLWCDPTITAEQAAARLGITAHALRDRAAHRGLPQRRSGRPTCVPREQFSEMWNAGVGPKALAAHFGANRPSTLSTLAKLLGLKRFARGAQRFTVEDYHQMKMAEAMAADARSGAARRRGLDA